MSENEELLASFTEHCRKYPTERFWQALRNWSGRNYVLVCDNKDLVRGEYSDTFYWRRKDSGGPT